MCVCVCACICMRQRHRDHTMAWVWKSGLLVRVSFLLSSCGSRDQIRSSGLTVTIDFVISLMCPQHTEEGLVAKSYEDLVRTTLQEALNTTRKWLRTVFKSPMLSRNFAAVQLSYPDEMAVSLPGSHKAAKGT